MQAFAQNIGVALVSCSKVHYLFRGLFTWQELASLPVRRSNHGLVLCSVLLYMLKTGLPISDMVYVFHMIDILQVYFVN